MPVETRTASLVTIPADVSKSGLAELERSVHELLQKGVKKLHLDCRQLSRTTSIHARALVMVWRQGQEQGVTVTLKSMPQSLIDVLRRLDLYELLTAGSSSDEGEALVGHDFPIRHNPTKFSFPASRAEATAALQRFSDYLLDLGLSEATRAELQIVFHEVVANILDHGQVAAESRIRFEAVATLEAMEMTFQDSGQPFDPTKATPVDDLVARSRSGQLRGYGIAMIRRMTDGTAYTRTKNGNNCLTLRRDWDR